MESDQPAVGTSGRLSGAEGGGVNVHPLGPRPGALSPRVASQMSRLPRRDTRPELAVRRAVFARGYRYRLHRPVPGMPRRTIDLVFVGPQVAVFIDGCFWHGCPEHGSVPKNNRQWWIGKLEANRRRDGETTAHLRALGWVVLRFWEHELPGDVAVDIDVCLRNRALSDRRRRLGGDRAALHGLDRLGDAPGQQAGYGVADLQC